MLTPDRPGRRLRLPHCALGILHAALLLAAAVPSAVSADDERLAETFFFESVKVGLGPEFPGARGAISYTGGVARLDFDFSNGGHYVSMGLGRVESGVVGIRGGFRCGCAADVSLVLRATDAKGDRYLARGAVLREADGWRDVSFDIRQPTWWFGPSTNAADRASMKWPVVAEILVEPSRRGLSGWTEARRVRLAWDAGAAIPADWAMSIRAPTGVASLMDPDGMIEIPYALLSLRPDGAAPSARLVRATVTDAAEGVVFEKTLGGPSGKLSIGAAELGGRFGAFKAAFSGIDAPGAAEREFASTWFARIVGRPKPVAWCGTGFHGWGSPERFRMMAAAGIGTARTDIYWRDWEKERGVYSCPRNGFRDSLDELHRLGIRLNAILTSPSHPLYGEPATEEMDCAWATRDRIRRGERTLDEDAFCNWVQYLVTHEGSDIDFHEIWNEAWNFYFGRFYSWSKKTGPSHGDKVWARKFAAFSRKVADAIREVRPDADIGVCSEDGQDTSLIWMLEAGIAREGDCVTFHPYTHKGDQRPERNPFFFADEGRRMKSAMAANGGASRLRITEYGWTTVRPSESGGHEHAFVGDYVPVTYREQARYMVRAYLLAHSFGVESMMQYDFKDDGPRRDYTEHNFGMTFENLTPKPSFAAVAFMTWALGDAKPLGDFGTDPDTHRILGFEFPDGRLAFAAWAVENPVVAPLPKELAGRAFTVHDLWGTPVRIGAETAPTLTEDPVYFIAAPRPPRDAEDAREGSQGLDEGMR